MASEAVDKGKIFYGQEPPSEESTAKECGVKYQLFEKLVTQIPLIFINISKTNYLLINHFICTTPDTEQIVILILHYLIIQKLKNVYEVITIWNSLPKLLKN